ncbi:hypothetical protein SDRG_15529 [Saprolegnia diclina VS20]|uniref:SMP-30/Gluconolactonase/LRE-like region domain-containing protein n=1 Tax=Saprolegnia diclina (strain VS20) TaxID=1156394 RepID=T0PMG8_SAPDV|nr:hypothetical protein SDRG_15529 [Saprolegnia diclina VS20]EQC26589.1 hypothetical protein SDRG_15529 [Saprolegnia diclina VS20]|eukprot:XP_008619927.1 hypothetical protein SDRG_15529 [Saprolegnia diclina VS20]
MGAPPQLLLDAPLPVSSSMVTDSGTYTVSTVFDASPVNWVLSAGLLREPSAFLLVGTDFGLFAANGSTNISLAEDAGLGLPFALAVDVNNTVLLADPTSDRVVSRLNSLAPVPTTDTSVYATLHNVNVSGSRGAVACPCVGCPCGGKTYIANTLNNSITILEDGVAWSLALDGSLKLPTALGIDSLGSTLYIADTGNHCIRSVALDSTALILATVAGTCDTWGYIDGTPSSTLFNSPQGLALDADDTIYVSDTGNHALRKITSSLVTTIIGQGGVYGFRDGSQYTARLHSPAGLIVYAPFPNALDIFVVDYNNQRLRQVHRERQ